MWDSGPFVYLTAPFWEIHSVLSTLCHCACMSWTQDSDPFSLLLFWGSFLSWSGQSSKKLFQAKLHWTDLLCHISTCLSSEKATEVDCSGVFGSAMGWFLHNSASEGRGHRGEAAAQVTHSVCCYLLRLSTMFSPFTNELSPQIAVVQLATARRPRFST